MFLHPHTKSMRALLHNIAQVVGVSWARYERIMGVIRAYHGRDTPTTYTSYGRSIRAQASYKAHYQPFTNSSSSIIAPCSKHNA